MDSQVCCWLVGSGSDHWNSNPREPSQDLKHCTLIALPHPHELFLSFLKGDAAVIQPEQKYTSLDEHASSMMRSVSIEEDVDGFAALIGSSESQDGQSRDLFVKVDRPEKHLEGYVSYNVTTKVCLKSVTNCLDGCSCCFLHFTHSLILIVLIPLSMLPYFMIYTNEKGKLATAQLCSLINYICPIKRKVSKEKGQII